MKFTHIAAIVLMTAASPALAAGDAAKGEKDFKKCKSCHTIANGDDVIVKGGKTGPNLYGVVGRQMGSTDFKYDKDLVALGESGMVWTEELITEFVADPTAFLRTHSDNGSARSKMTFKLKKGENVAAYLASVAQ